MSEKPKVIHSEYAKCPHKRQIDGTLSGVIIIEFSEITPSEKEAITASLAYVAESVNAGVL